MMEPNDVRAILESVLFASPVPVKFETLVGILPESSKEAILEQLLRLKEECGADSRGIDLIEVAGGYQYRTKPCWAGWVARLKKAKTVRLSQSALETLAIVAYRQPVIRPEIEEIRGVDSGWILRSLMEKELIKMVGRKDLPGRPIIYGTTKAFLELFNLNSLSDLPRLKEIQAPLEVEQGPTTESPVEKIDGGTEEQVSHEGCGDLETPEPVSYQIEVDEAHSEAECELIAGTMEKPKVEIQAGEGVGHDSAFHPHPPPPLEE